MKVNGNQNQINSLIYSTPYSQDNIKFSIQNKKKHSNSIDRTNPKNSKPLSANKNVNNLIYQVERPGSNTTKSSRTNMPR